MNTLTRLRVRGFTLVELLIVVSIIGVLATIGVPTFRTMVQKAKKSEAKVALGGLYTAETAFFSEYGTYGSVLDKIGFDLEGSQANRTYNVGFLAGACTAAGGPAAGAASIPLKSAAAGSALNLAFPGYYLGTQDFAYSTTKFVGSGCTASVINTTDFTAGAAGNIAPGASALTDIWKIDRFRNLANVQDGTAK